MFKKSYEFILCAKRRILLLIILLTVLDHLILEINATTSFTTVTVSVSPKTVGSSSTISMSATLPSSTYYATGDVITFSLPSPGSFPTTGSTTCTSSTSGITISSQTISTYSVSLTLTATTSTTKFQCSCTLWQNPPSTATYSGITTSLVSSSGTSRATYSATTLSNLAAAQLTAGSISPQSDQIGASGTTIHVSLTTTNSLSSTGYIVVYFPQWNPDSTYSNYHYIETTQPTCTSITGLSASLLCTYNEDTQRLTLSNILTSTAAGGTTLKFSVSNFLNPYSGVSRDGFYIYTSDSTGGQIDSSNGFFDISIQVSTWAEFASYQVLRTDGITDVGQSSEVDLLIYLDLPVDASCRIMVVFPDDIPIDSALTTVSVSGTIDSTGSVTKVTASNYFTIDGCSSYSDATNTAQISMQYLSNKNYVENPSDTFEIYLYAVDSGSTYPIAKQVTDLTLSDFTTGDITSFTVTATDDSTIQEDTRYTITWKPSTDMGADSKILITFPSTITLDSTSTCSIANVNGMSSSATCSVSGSVLTITEPFGSSGSYTYSSSGAALSFIFSPGGTNPDVVKDAGSFTVQSFYSDDGGTTYYAVDDTTFTPVYTPTAALLTASVTSLSSYSTGAYPVTYTLSITPGKDVPEDGQLTVEFPTEVTVASGYTMSCSYTYNGVSYTVSSSDISTSSPITVDMSDYFSSSDYTADGNSFSLVCSNLQNPRYATTTSSFEIATTDSSSNAIESVSTGVTATISGISSFTSFTVTPSSYVNGYSTQYKVACVSPIDMYNGDKIIFTFPSEVGSPASGSCTAISPVSTMSCSISGDTMTVTLSTFSSSPLSAGTTFSFYVNSVTNPPSTETTSAFTSITATDSSGNQLLQYTGSDVTITTTTPTPSTSYSLTQSDEALSASATYTFSYTTMNDMVSGGTFIITAPDTVTLPASMSTCYVTYNSVDYAMTCSISGDDITIESGLSTAIPDGATIKIVLGPITNPSSASATDSFKIVSYTDDTQVYKIDQVASGLIPSLECTYPCKTCATSDDSKCYTCFTTSGSTYPYYYGDDYDCLEECPDGYYGDSSYICQDCPTECLTCSSSTVCLTCYKYGKYPYFYEDWCYATCPDGYYSSSYKCKSCDSSCKTCSGSSTTCTSCYTSGLFRYLQNGSCVNKCSSGYVAVGYTCYQCTSPCSTCTGSTTQCVTCKTGYLYGTTCVSKCPTGYTLSNGYCKGCDPLCSLCSSADTTKCLLCDTGYYLYNNTCLSSCPDGYKLDTNKTYCQYVEPVVVVPNNTNTTNNTVNPIHQVQYDEAVGSLYVYFPITTTQTILGGISAGSYLKDAASLWHSNSIGLWGPLEFIGYGAQIYLAYQKLNSQSPIVNSSNSTNSTSNSTTSKRGRLLDTSTFQSAQMGVLPLVFYGTAFSFLVKIVSNIIFALIFMMIIKRDNGFKEYQVRHKCTPLLIYVFGTMFSFKLYKFFYSRFFGMEQCYIPLEYPQRMHQAFNVLTILNMVLSLLPIIFVDIYGIIKYSWGDQFYIILIETLILSVSMLILQILEFRAQKIIAKPYGEDLIYAQLEDQSAMEEQVMKRVDEELRKKFGGMTLENYVEKLKREHQQYDELPQKSTTKNLDFEKAQSMADLGDRDREEDDRRTVTEPRDLKKSFKDQDQFDNVYAVPSSGKKKNVPNDKQVTKVIQFGDDAMTGAEYDEDFRRRMNERGKATSGFYETNGPNDDDYPSKTKKRKGMRGRKGKYYAQVEDEDSSFFDKGQKQDEEEDDEDDDDLLRAQQNNLKKIEEEREETHHSDQNTQRRLDENTKLLSSQEFKKQESPKKQDTQKESQKNQKKEATPLKHLEDDILNEANMEQNNNQNDENQFFEEEVAQGEQSYIPQNQQQNNNDVTKGEQNNGKKADKKQDDVQNVKNNESVINQDAKLLDEEKQVMKEAKELSKNNSQQSYKKIQDDNVMNDIAEFDDIMDAQAREYEEQHKNDIENSQQQQDNNNSQQQQDLVRQQQLSQDQNQNQNDQNGNNQKEQKKIQQQNDNDHTNNNKTNALENKKIDEKELDKIEQDIDALNPKFNTTLDIKKDIEQMIDRQNQNSKQDREKDLSDNNDDDKRSETGIPDSDDDDEQRIKNMLDPDKKRFNVNDILGKFDRDEKGNPLILQDKKGDYVDKDGNRVNQKGYLIDENTGDVVEKEKKRKIFDFNDLDERGELPPPFNLERFNFNAHDVRGYFDKDSDGNEIIGNKRDAKGNLVDKLGRKINQHGFLVDDQGNLVDKRGRIKLSKHMLEKTGGDLPQLFNYKGKKFDVRDIMGSLDKDRNGNIIVRRDKFNQMVDKKGRRVNSKGYLIDDEGNVINKEGKLVFEKHTLSKDDEVPKLFPFLKFNLDEIKGDYEMDPLGNPMLKKTRDGNYVDSKGRRVNEKGYLLDENGNIVNRRDKKVFNKMLLEDDGDIPKIFRTGLLRKDTSDSFAQLMSEIEDLERMQEMQENDPRMKAKLQKKMKEENERFQKKIDQIIEDENDDEELMKELEELAGNDDGDGISEGGNTSVDSLMEDTPSNYNIANQRFNEIERIRNRAKQGVRQQMQVPEDEEVTEYSYFPDMKKKKKKKKKKKQKEGGTIDDRQLLMAKAYGGLSQAQYDKLLQMKRMQQQSEMSHRNLNKDASQLSTLNARRDLNIETSHRLYEDPNSEWEDRTFEQNTYDPPNNRGGNYSTVNAKNPTYTQNITGRNDMGKNTTSRKVKPKQKIIKNNLMGSTMKSQYDLNDDNIDPRQLQFNENNQRKQQRISGNKIDSNAALQKITNSVSGFYQEQNQPSDQVSNMSRTQDSFAQNVGPRRFESNNNGPKYVKKETSKSPPRNDQEEIMKNRYQTQRGSRLDIMSDWEKDSDQSEQSVMSQFTQVNNQKRIKGLETIYLQRLEPKKSSKSQLRGVNKARFRVMHHKYHDEPEWHIDDNRDELDSIISGNYKEMQRKFEEEFQGTSSKGGKKQMDDKERINIFHGNLRSYKEKQYQKQISTVDLSKN